MIVLSADIEYQVNQFKLKFQIELPAGQIHALIGASGSGKTTLLRLLCGIAKPGRGRITCGDKVLFDHMLKIFVPPQKRNIGLIFQDYALFEHMTVFENIGYGIDKNKRNNVANEWLERIGLHGKADAYPADLSGGEKQRVALARALAASPDVLLMDEPFAALNSQLRLELRRMLKQLIKESGIPVVIAIHDLNEAQLIADYVSVLSHGELLQRGSVDKVFAAPNSIRSAQALGWHNILKVRRISEHNLIVNNVQIYFETLIPEKVSHIALPTDAFKLEPLNPQIKGKLLDIVKLDDFLYCDVQVDNETFLRIKLAIPASHLSIGVEYGFTIFTDKVVLLS